MKVPRRGDNAVRTRISARVVLLDSSDRVVLLKIEDPSVFNPLSPNTPRSFWTTIGGRVEDNESLETTARREVGEELGITDLILGPLIWEVHQTLDPPRECRPNQI